MRPAAPAVVLALLLVLPTAAAGGPPVAIPCALPAAVCDVLATLCPLVGLFCPPPPPGHVDIFGDFPCSPSTCGFNPASITVQVGASVTWSNTALGTSHSATSDDNLFDTGVLSPGTTSDPVLFQLAGTYAYHCALHASMAGTVIVEA